MCLISQSYGCPPQVCIWRETCPEPLEPLVHRPPREPLRLPERAMVRVPCLPAIPVPVGVAGCSCCGRTPPTCTHGEKESRSWGVHDVLQASCMEWDQDGQYLAVAEGTTAVVWCVALPPMMCAVEPLYTE